MLELIWNIILIFLTIIFYKIFFEDVNYINKIKEKFNYKLNNFKFTSQFIKAEPNLKFNANKIFKENNNSTKDDSNNDNDDIDNNDINSSNNDNNINNSNNNIDNSTKDDSNNDKDINNLFNLTNEIKNKLI